MSDIRWEGFSHAEIYARVHSGPGPGVSEAAASAWALVANTVKEIDQQLAKAIADIGGGWEGVAADAAVGGLTPLGRWSAEAAEAARATSEAIAAQANHAGELRRAMPAPMDEERKFALDWLSTDPYGGLFELIEVEEESRARTEDAVRLMNQYTAVSNENRRSMDQLWTEPPEVTVDVLPAAVGASGGVGGIPVSGLGSTPSAVSPPSVAPAGATPSPPAAAPAPVTGTSADSGVVGGGSSGAAPGAVTPGANPTAAPRTTRAPKVGGSSAGTTPVTGAAVDPSSAGSSSTGGIGSAGRESAARWRPGGEMMPSTGGAPTADRPGSSSTVAGRGYGAPVSQRPGSASVGRDRKPLSPDIPDGAAVGRVRSGVSPLPWQALPDTDAPPTRLDRHGREVTPPISTDDVRRTGGPPARSGLPVESELPLRGSVKPTVPPGGAPTGYVPPVVPPGMAGTETTRRRPDYLLDDTDAFADDRWIPPGVLSADDLPPRTSSDR